MSLLLPTNIGARDDSAEILYEMLRVSGDSVACQISDGVFRPYLLDAAEQEEVADAVANLQFVYVLKGLRVAVEPIAGFIASRTLRRVSLRYLIDGRPLAVDGRLPPSTTGTLRRIWTC